MGSLKYNENRILPKNFPKNNENRNVPQSDRDVYGM